VRDNYLSAQYRRLAARRGDKRAILAVAHTALVIAYHILKKQQNYQELGADYVDRLNADTLRRSLISGLELGHRVVLEDSFLLFKCSATSGGGRVGSAEELASWVTAHPGVTTITRDRHGRYAGGARRAAPDATRVADGFHLVRNLRQTVEGEVAVHRQDLRVSLSNPITPPAKPEGEKKTGEIRVRSSVAERHRKAVEQQRQGKLHLFQTIQ
jgi:hypothetical protein